MVDFSTTGEEDFHVKRWVNTTLRSGRAPDETVEAFVSVLVMKLQLLAQDVENSIDEITGHAIACIPRATREIEKVRREATALRGKIEETAGQLSVLEENSHVSVRFLAELDRLKTTLETCSGRLKEAEKAKKLMGDIEGFFAGNDPMKIAEELMALQESLKVLCHVPGFHEDRQRLGALQDRLEGMVSSGLADALSGHDVGPMRQYLDVFTKMDRVERLYDHYFRWRRIALQERWNSFRPTGGDSFLQWLPKFHDDVLAMLKRESQWCQQVFPNAASLLPRLLVECLSSLTDSFRDRVDTVIEDPNATNPLLDLIALYDATCGFARSILALMAGANDDVLRSVLRAVFEPFFLYQCAYPDLERQFLDLELSRLDISVESFPFMETIHRLEGSVPKVFLLIQSAIERCMQFTKGTEADGVVNIVGDVLGKYVQRVFTVLRHLRTLAHLEDLYDERDKVEESGGAAERRIGVNPYSHDWTFFQGAMHFIQVCHQMITRLRGFDSILRDTLLRETTSLEFNGTRGSPEQQACSLHLENDVERRGRVRGLMTKLLNPEFQLLPGPGRQFESLREAGQRFCCDTLCTIVKDNLNGLHASEVWEAVPQPTPGGLELPTFSSSPSPYITRIGEHLLTVPQQLEPYISSEGTLLSSSDLRALLSRVVSKEEGSETGVVELVEEGVGEDDEARFAAGWITAVSRCTESLYLQEIVHIARLSKMGASQLETDLGYLSNVLSALGVTPSPPLRDLPVLLMCTLEEFDERAQELGCGAQIVRAIGTARRGESSSPSSPPVPPASAPAPAPAPP